MRGNFLFKIIDKYIGILFLWIGSFFVSKKQKTQPLNFQPHHILVVKLSALGDTVLLSSALRAIRKKYPRAKITAIGTSINEEVFRNSRYLDEVILFRPSTPFSLMGFFLKNRFDLAFDFDQWLRVSAIFTLFSRAKIRVGFKTEGQHKHYIFTHYAEHQRNKHEIDCFLDLIAKVGIPPDGRRTEFNLGEKSISNARKLISSLTAGAYAGLILLHMETPRHAPQRRWPQENYILLAKKIIDRYGGKIKVLINQPTGGKVTSEITTLTELLKGSIFVLPKLSLEEYAAVISLSKIFITPNTGVMHLACAVGTNVIALHGPTDVVKWGPVSFREGQICLATKSPLSCSPCLYLGFEYGCKENKCMNAISVEGVFEEVKKILGGGTEINS